MAARRLRRLLGARDREQRLQHIRRAPAVPAGRELSEPRRAQRGDQRGRDIVADAGRAAVHEPDVTMAVEQRQRGRVRVSGGEIDAESLPERGHLFASPGRKLPRGAKSIPVVEQHRRRVDIGIGGDLGQRHRGGHPFRKLEEKGGVKRAGLVARGMEGSDDDILAGCGRGVERTRAVIDEVE